MSFSFENLSFWPIAAIALVCELLHLVLAGRWPALRNAQPGPATFFLLFEALVVLAPLAAGVGEIQRLIKARHRSLLKIAVTTVAVPSIILVLILVWNR